MREENFTRRTELDYINAAACLCVILIHVLSYGIGGYGPQSWQAAVIYFPWRLAGFVVPAFSFTGAVKMALFFGDRKITAGVYLHYIWERILHIYFPYVIWAAVYYLYLYSAGYMQGSFSELTAGIFRGSLSGQFYYIVIVMQFYLLMPLWIRLVRRVPFFGVAVCFHISDDDSAEIFQFSPSVRLFFRICGPDVSAVSGFLDTGNIRRSSLRQDDGEHTEDRSRDRRGVLSVHPVRYAAGVRQLFPRGNSPDRSGFSETRNRYHEHSSDLGCLHPDPGKKTADGKAPGEDQQSLLSGISVPLSVSDGGDRCSRRICRQHLADPNGKSDHRVHCTVSSVCRLGKGKELYPEIIAGMIPIAGLFRLHRTDSGRTEVVFVADLFRGKDSGILYRDLCGISSDIRNRPQKNGAACLYRHRRNIRNISVFSHPDHTVSGHADSRMEEALGGNVWSSINLVPFRDILNRTGVYNVILTIPAGFLAPALSRKPRREAQKEARRETRRKIGKNSAVFSAGDPDRTGAADAADRHRLHAESDRYQRSDLQYSGNGAGVCSFPGCEKEGSPDYIVIIVLFIILLWSSGFRPSDLLFPELLRICPKGAPGFFLFYLQAVSAYLSAFLW